MQFMHPTTSNQQLPSPSNRIIVELLLAAKARSFLLILAMAHFLKLVPLIDRFQRVGFVGVGKR